MNRNRINAFLLLLVILLGTLTWWSGRESPPAPSVLLTQLLPDRIHSISISNKSGPTIIMQRDDNGWHMNKPFSIEANRARIQQLLEILVIPVRAQFGTEQNNLSEFGLAPPLALLQLDQLEIRVGNTDPINHYRYLGIGNNLYLIQDLFPHLLLAPAEAFVSPNILPQGKELDLIETPQWRLERQPDRVQTWRLTPALPGISTDRLTEKVDAWKNAQALKVVKAPAVPADFQIEIGLNGSDTTLVFGILRQQQGTLLLRKDLGLAYDLPGTDALLVAPTESARVP